jgi:serine/threonine-protein kinase
VNVEIGDIVAGQYRLDELIGQGGMGAVYRATHVGLADRVAVKLVDLPAGTDRGPKSAFWKRFRREARVAFQLRHDNAVRVLDFGEDDGRPYLVMEFLEGRPLSDDLETGEPVEPLDRAVRIAKSLAGVLVEMHRQSLVHRDLKPANVILLETEEGERPVLVDFGLAYLMDSETLGRVTQGGEVVGTPHYLAPEQGRGEVTIGPAADIYAFGGLLFEMLTGRVPFDEGSPAELVSKHMFVPPPSVTDMRGNEYSRLPEQLVNLVDVMLTKEPAARPSAEEVHGDLGRLLRGERNRKRGRPARYLEKRADRAIESPEGGDVEEDRSGGECVVGVVGDIEDDWRMSLGAAGYACRRIEVDGCEQEDVDIVFVPEADAEVVERLESVGPVLAGCDPADFDNATDLLQTAAVDVVTRPVEASKLVDKLDRIWRKRSYRGEHE